MRTYSIFSTYTSIFPKYFFSRQPEIYECDDSCEEWEYDEDESPMLLPGLLSRTKFRNEYLSDPYVKETCLNLHGKVEVTNAVRNWVQKMCDKNNALGQNKLFCCCFKVWDNTSVSLTLIFKSIYFFNSHESEWCKKMFSIWKAGMPFNRSRQNIFNSSLNRVVHYSVSSLNFGAQNYIWNEIWVFYGVFSISQNAFSLHCQNYGLRNSITNTSPFSNDN